MFKKKKTHAWEEEQRGRFAYNVDVVARIDGVKFKYDSYNKHLFAYHPKSGREKEINNLVTLGKMITSDG